MIQYLNEEYKQGMAKTYFCLCAAGPMPDIVNYFHLSPFRHGLRIPFRQCCRKPLPFECTYPVNYLPSPARQQVLKNNQDHFL